MLSLMGVAVEELKSLCSLLQPGVEEAARLPKEETLSSRDKVKNESGRLESGGWPGKRSSKCEGSNDTKEYV